MQTELSPEAQAAVHTAKNAAQAVETAREASMHKAIEASADTTRAALADALRDVFGENQDAGRFIDVTRIPLICAAIVNMHSDIAEMKENFKWGVRIIIGAVLVGVLKLLLNL